MGSLSLEILAQGGAEHGAAMGGMCPHTPLHPLLPEGSFKGKFMCSDTQMVPVVPVGPGHDAWSKGELPTRGNRLLWRDI